MAAAARVALRLVLAFLVAGAPTASGAQTPVAAAERPPPGRLRVLRAPQTATPPVIDGHLDDSAWASAAVADPFWVTDQERWPTEQTQVLVTADGENLYFAFRVFDRQPEFIQAIQTRRDGAFGFDDQIAVQLDPFFTRREISTYRVNARGTQSDEIGGGRARQRIWRGDWRAAAMRTDYGWAAEIAIPFDILNFEPGTERMGVNFLRYHHRTMEWSRWADVTVRNLPEEMGQLIGLQPILVAREDPWTFLPYAMIGRNIRNRSGDVEDLSAAAGLDIRYQPRPNLTGVLSLFPDFSQVESAVTNIDFNYNEKTLDETRPFFQEGSAYFGETRLQFYSNRVPNFDFGAKTFGRVGDYQFGGLVTHGEDDRSDAVLDFRRLIGQTRSIGFVAVGTDRRDLNNQLYAVRARGRERSGLNYALDAAETRTDPAPGDGSFQQGTLGWDWDFWSISGTASRYSTWFRPENGIVARDLLGTKGGQANLGYYRDRPEGLIRELAANFSFEERNTDDGRLQRRKYYADASAELREQQIKFGVSYYAGPYRPVAGGPGLWAAGLNDDHYWNGSIDFNTRSSRFGYGIAYSSGELGGGDYEYTVGYIWTRPTSTTFVNVNSELLKNFGSFHQTIVTAGWDITPAHTLAARVITAYYGDAYRLAYTWRVRDNIDFFAVYDDFPGAPTAISAKVIATF